VSPSLLEPDDEADEEKCRDDHPKDHTLAHLRGTHKLREGGHCSEYMQFGRSHRHKQKCAVSVMTRMEHGSTGLREKRRVHAQTPPRQVRSTARQVRLLLATSVGSRLTPAWLVEGDPCSPPRRSPRSHRTGSTVLRGG
jgi:hypothetical protein